MSSEWKNGTGILGFYGNNQCSDVPDTEGQTLRLKFLNFEDFNKGNALKVDSLTTLFCTIYVLELY